MGWSVCERRRVKVARKELPYFPWYVADAETDSHYSAMNDAELGFYHRCLNYAWVNGGVPADPVERARVLNRTLTYANKKWVRVGKCFSPSENPELLVNPRQERERQKALSRKHRATEAANIRHFRNADASPKHCLDDANGLPRAFVSVSESVSGFRKLPTEAKPFVPGAVANSFAAFWKRWCELTGRKQRESYACQAWISVVEFDTQALAMACLERYGASAEVNRGVVTNPDKWIYEQARDDWKGDWPAAPVQPPPTGAQGRRRSAI